jgi:hypothetical protein
MLHVATERSCIGEVSYAPYDQLPLSTTVQAGWLPVEPSTLPQTRDVAAEWLLGVLAPGLNLAGREVHLVDGRRVPFAPIVFWHANAVDQSSYLPPSQQGEPGPREARLVAARTDRR